jgi:phytoene/squalene synthetase
MIRARQQQSNIYADHQVHSEEDNAYLPLVRVALESEDTERGTAAAIQVLALRRGNIDRRSRLLPQNVPVSLLLVPFLFLPWWTVVTCRR